MFSTKDMKRTDLICAAIVAISFITAVGLRLYKLVQIPYGLHIDEAGMAYDAWSLANYGVDRWMTSYPIYLNNFGGGQSILQAYLCAILIKINHGNVNEWLIRLPGVAVNMCGYVAGVFIVKKTMGKAWAAVSAILLAIMPYFIMQCRFGLDCNLLVNMLTISLCLLMIASEKKQIGWFILTGISWGLTYYTYALCYIANTIILVIFSVLLVYRDRKLLKNVICMWIPIAVLGFPLFLMILINQFDLPQIMLGAVTITKLPSYRGGELTLNIKTMFENVGYVLASIFTYDKLPYNAFDKHYTLYMISIPFVMIGATAYTKQALNNIRDKKWDLSLIFGITLAIYFFMSLCLKERPNVNRLNGLFFVLFYMLLWGIRWLYNKLSHKILFGVILGGIYAVSFISFTHYYFNVYPTKVYPQYLFMAEYSDMLDYIDENNLSDRKIYVDSYFNDTYIYFMYSAKVDPYTYNLPEHGSMEYENYFFKLPEEYEEGAVYLVRETNEKYIEQIEMYTTNYYKSGMFICFW